MSEALVNYLDKFGPELLVIQFGFLIIVSTLFLWLWFSNRRKYHNLKHAIPANVVKNYLDSIIQNSTALKSSLFRGGGLDLNGAIPSVMPLNTLGGGDSLGLSGAPSTALLEELNQKKAHIAALESQLSPLQIANREMEARIQNLQGQLSAAEKKIKELEALLAEKRASGGGDASLKAELDMLTRERDEIRDRLKEFEIISDDLANLKRLQQENEQLKRSLAAQGISLPTPVAAPAPVPAANKAPPTLKQADVADLLSDLGQNTEVVEDDNKALEDFLSSPDEIAAPEAEAPEEEIEAAAEDKENKPKSDKTPEDLLSEFEKMLG